MRESPQVCKSNTRTACGILPHSRAWKIGYDAPDKRMLIRILPTAAALVLMTGRLLAHHGQNFIWLEDAMLPHRADGVFLSDYEWQRQNGDDSQSYNLATMWGLADGLAASLFATAGDETGATEWQSMQPTLHFARELNDAIYVGFSLGYQFALRDSEHQHMHEDAGCDPDIDLGPDAPPCVPGAGHSHGHSHSHSVIHNHGINAAVSRWIVRAQLSKDMVFVGNLIAVKPEGDDLGFGYAMGVRQQVTDSLNLGLESIGDIESHGERAVMAAAYWEPVDSLICKFGIGTGLNSRSADLIVRSGLVWNF